MFSFLSHFLFRQRQHEVIIQDESYTTQACVKCGILKKDVGSSAVYNCSRCNYKIGRDISGEYIRKNGMNKEKGKRILFEKLILYSKKFKYLI